MKKFAELGLKIQITELDISVYPKEHTARERRPEDSDTAFTPEKENKQMEVYKRLTVAELIFLMQLSQNELYFSVSNVN